MSPSKESNSTILNNLNAHVDSGDVLFVVSGDASNNQLALEAFNKRCQAKCRGRKKLNRSLHSKVVDASQFAACEDIQCSDILKNVGADDASIQNEISEVAMERSAENTTEQLLGKLNEKKLKRLDGSNQIRIRARGPPPVDSKWKRNVILRQMKNHRISSTSMDSGSRPKLMIRPVEKLMVLQDVFDTFVSRKKWDSVSLDTENISGIMSRIGLSKYGFKITNKSPYATNVNKKKTRRRARSVIDIIPRHNCFESEDSRVPSYMGWNWTKCFSEMANTGWRPGAIPRNIRDLMTYFNGPCCSCMPSDVATCVTYDKKLAVEKAEKQIVARKPTLRVVRRDGLYYVCMNPLKSTEELAQSQNPYLDDCPPIKFQIALNGKRRQQVDDDDMGLLGYPCSELPAICEDNKEMQDLLNLLAEECENDKEFFKLAKTLCAKPSDLDIEFIAPGANVSSDNFKEGIYKETQYDKNDFDDTFGKVVSRSLPTLSTGTTKKSAA